MLPRLDDQPAASTVPAPCAGTPSPAAARDARRAWSGLRYGHTMPGLVFAASCLATAEQHRLRTEASTDLGPHPVEPQEAPDRPTGIARIAST